ncbi:MAG TPA: MBL fold metallo-hydrolase [Candidatus Bathyarchaeia archaeon]|nr:MBL fold metallo-hydrolase [Candidatus Bathyarchaeia archaeon]
MHTKQIGENLLLIDLQTGGFKNLIASYLLKGKQTTIIETGPTSSIPNLLSALKELKVKPEEVAYIAVSHVHIDHAGGAGTLLKKLPNAKVIVHPKGAPHLVDPEKLWLSSQSVLGDVAKVFGSPEPVPEDRIINAANGMEINVGDNMKLKVVETLGHASHHLSYYESLHGGVFPGEAAGMYLSEFDTVIPTSPPPFHFDAALASLNALIALKPTVLYYSHFGKAPNAAEWLRKHAIQLKLWMNIAKDAVRKQESPSVVRERILAEDENMSAIADFLEAHPIYSTLVEESIQGFIESATKASV